MGEAREGLSAYVGVVKTELETLVRRSQSCTEEEVARLWEAMDTHTHDVEMDSDEEASKTVKKTVTNISSGQSYGNALGSYGSIAKERAIRTRETILVAPS